MEREGAGAGILGWPLVRQDPGPGVYETRATTTPPVRAEANHL
jgi:hypothetical protein